MLLFLRFKNFSLSKYLCETLSLLMGSFSITNQSVPLGTDGGRDFNLVEEQL